MRRAATGLAAALPACAASMAFAQPAPSPPPPAWPVEDMGHEYLCTAVHRDPQGTLTMSVTVSGPSPGDRAYLGQWTSAESAGGLTLSYYLYEEDMQARDDTFVSLTFAARWRGNPRVRVLLRRGPAYTGVGLAFRSDYERAVRGRLSTGVPLGELRAYAGGTPLAVMVIDRRGRALAQDRLDPARLDAALAAAEAVRSQARAMADDYRNRCERREAQEVIVT